MNGALHIESLTKVYRSGLLGGQRLVALDEISLDVQPGEILAVLGMNGAGKTTLTKCALNLVHPTSGSAWMLGCPFTGGGWRGRVGYLPEIVRMPPGLQPRDLLTLVGRVSKRSGAWISGRISYWLERLSINSRDGDGPVLSKGVSRRLALATALLPEPDLLFLDEPTDGLDPSGKKTVREILLELKSRGAAVVLSSHLLSEVEEVADRLIILRRGRIAVAGTLTELTANGHGLRILAGGRGDHGAGFRSGASYVAQNESEAGRLLEKLGEEGADVVAVIPVRATLEDLFEKYAL